MVKDALGRSWQLGTVQLDYQLPERFDLAYVGADNKKHRPVMIHRAPYGSLERFIALLIEHTGGKFPLWLAPDQVAVLPIAENYAAYADQVCNTLRASALRSFVDHSELTKIPYMLIVGEKEQQAKEVAVRKQGAGDQGSMPVDKFVQTIVAASSPT